MNVLPGSFQALVAVADVDVDRCSCFGYCMKFLTASFDCCSSLSNLRNEKQRLKEKQKTNHFEIYSINQKQILLRIFPFLVCGIVKGLHWWKIQEKQDMLDVKLWKRVKTLNGVVNVIYAAIRRKIG